MLLDSTEEIAFVLPGCCLHRKPLFPVKPLRSAASRVKKLFQKNPEKIPLMAPDERRDPDFFPPEKHNPLVRKLTAKLKATRSRLSLGKSKSRSGKRSPRPISDMVILDDRSNPFEEDPWEKWAVAVMPGSGTLPESPLLAVHPPPFAPGSWKGSASTLHRRASSTSRMFRYAMAAASISLPRPDIMKGNKNRPEDSLTNIIGDQRFYEALFR